MTHFGAGVDWLVATLAFASRPWLWVPVLVFLVLLPTARGRAVLLGLLIGLDILANVLLRGSFRETLSSRAHRMRVKGQPYWGWTAKAIDGMFFRQADHCRKQYELEVSKGWHT